MENTKETRAQACRRWSALVAAWGVAAIPAWAQVGADAGAPELPPAVSPSLAEVVVTAQRREQNLQSVPIAVTAINADTLTASGLQSTSQLAMMTPGLNITESAGGYVLPRIRGVGTSAAGPGIENPVATYIDGIYISSQTGAMTSLANIAQVAILKGPQGTLFGRNATGGLIQITTRDPTSTLSGEASATYGSQNTVGGNFYIADGLTDHIRADLAAYYSDQRDGFGRNVFNGQDVNGGHDLALRNKWVGDFGDALTAKLIFDYANSSSANPAFRPAFGTLPVGAVPFTGGDWDVNSNIQPNYNSTQGGIGLTLTHHFGRYDLVSITGYRRSAFHALFDNDKTPAQITGTDLHQDDRSTSQELQLISTGSGPLQWTVGGYYFSANGSYDPLYIITNPTTRRIRIADEQGAESYALYGQSTYEVTPSLHVTGGLRYTSETRDFTGNQVLLNGPATIPVATGANSTVANRPTWRLAVDYQLASDTLGYISYDRGFKSAGYNPQTFPAVPYQPEKLDAYEIGLKNDLLDRRLRINTALFYYDYKNIQVSGFTNGVLTIVNAASAKIYGLDLDLTANVGAGLTVTGGVSALHDRYASFPGAQKSTPLPAGGNAIGTDDARGNRLLQTPDWTLNLAADETFRLGKGEMRFNVTYYHNDGWFADAENRLRQGAYDLVNTSATYSFADGRYSIMAWGRNLGNKAYAVQMNSQAVGDAIMLAPARTFGLTLTGRF